MSDCCDNFEFFDDTDSFESWQGLVGPYYVPHLSADGVLSWTNTGSLPNPQPVDISGPPGSSVELRGPVPSVQDLPATASSSELWLVGAASPYDGYFYNGVRWENAGQIAVGPAGPQGPAGADGSDGSNGVTFTPTVSSSGVISWTNDGGLPNPESVNIKGPAGQDGTNGQDGAPGAAAGFGTPTATVDANVGTPSVEISASGLDTAKVFSFAFHNIKGEPGSGGGGPDPYTSNPADLAAAASPGSASQYSRGDHVHKLPSAAQIGAYVKPSGGIPASDLASGVIPSVPSAYTSNPEMDGTASPGSSTAWAKGDHVHPHDTSRATVANYTGTLAAASWSGASAPYSQALTVNGLLASDTPTVDVVMSGTYSTDEARKTAWAAIYRAVTSADTLTVYASELPTVDLPIQIQCVR